MDGVDQVLLLWKDAAIVVLVTLLAVALFHYATKVWSAPADAVLGAFLGGCLGAVGATFYFSGHFLGMVLSRRAFWFIVLYLWCILVMLFFASRDTSPVKLLLGLASQAGILYALFIFL